LFPDEAVEELEAHLTTGAERRPALKLLGSPGSGRTTVLDRLGERLQGGGRPVIRVTPSGDWDSGLGIVLQLAAHMASLGEDRAYKAVRDPSRLWEDKVEAVREAAEALAPRRPILLIDPVDSVYRERPHDDFPATGCLEDAWQLVFRELHWSRLVAASRDRPSASTYRLQSVHPGASWLRTSAWGTLAPAADRLASEGEEALGDLSPLDLRLMVALAELEGAPFAARKVRDPIYRPVSLLALRVAGDPLYVELKRVWARLALVRTPFDRELLQKIGAGGLGERERDLLERCLLSRRGASYVLHPILRSVLRSEPFRDRPWLDPVEARSTHELLRNDHRERRDRLRAGAVSPPREAVLHHAEAFHHAQAAGDMAGAMELRLGFIEELDALGRSLSEHWRRRGEAAQVFEQVLSIDPDHAYAHHYLAYNLDIEGRDPDRVEKHYRRAVEEQPEHPWWHSRWIRFLLTEGRSREARRAFGAAMAELAPTEPHRSSFYRQLHLEVARMALHRMDLELAGEVLDLVPAGQREDLTKYGPLARRLRVLREVQQNGAVFPAWMSPDAWWQGPHLFQRDEPELGHLRGWCSARVDGTDPEAEIVRFRVARPPAAEGAAPTYGWMEVGFEALDRLRARDCPSARELTEDTFVELAWFARNGSDEAPVTQVRIFKPAAPEALPRIFPDPDRYLRRWRAGEDGRLA